MASFSGRWEHPPASFFCIYFSIGHRPVAVILTLPASTGVSPAMITFRWAVASPARTLARRWCLRWPRGGPGRRGGRRP